MNGNINIRLYKELVSLLNENKKTALSTVTRTIGSTPQKAGSTAIIGPAGIISGTIGGGFIEHQIIQDGINALTTGQSNHYNFQLTDEMAEENSVICGGGMHVLLDGNPAKHLPVFKEIINSLEKKEHGVLLTKSYQAEDNFIIERFWFTHENEESLPQLLPAEVAGKVKSMLNQPVKQNFLEHNMQNQYFILENITPLPRLIIAGAGHVGKALSHIGKLLDFEVTVWDDRSEYACRENLPDADIILQGNVDDTLSRINPDQNTYIAIITRGHKMDAAVLKKFIGSNAAYVGMIGSMNKINQVRDKFFQENWTNAQQWDQIYTPIGLDIGAVTVQEIAVSIAAELIKIRGNLHQSQ